MTPLDTRALRNAFGTFMTGVTVVTSHDTDGQPLGFTANSFTSVSLDPPMILVCLANTSRNYDTLVNADGFAVNILSEAQIERALSDFGAVEILAKPGDEIAEGVQSDIYLVSLTVKSETVSKMPSVSEDFQYDADDELILDESGDLTDDELTAIVSDSCFATISDNI